MSVRVRVWLGGCQKHSDGSQVCMSFSVDQNMKNLTELYRFQSQ